jgi:hypothetical protein
MSKGPESALEKHLVEDYLKTKGYTLEDLYHLTPEDRKALMKEACMYASLKLSELESKSRFRDDIRAPS